MARTPSAAAHRKVLDAAFQLIEERGIEAASVDAICQLSGVSKATVYKHWKDKETLWIDVIAGLREAPPQFSSGNARQDLVDFLTHLSKADKPDRLMKIWPRIIGYAMTNPNFAKALQEFSFAPRRAQISRILADGSARGQLPGGIDASLAMDLLIGPIMHRRFAVGEVPAGFPEKVVNSFLRSQGVTR